MGHGNEAEDVPGEVLQDDEGRARKPLRFKRNKIACKRPKKGYRKDRKGRDPKLMAYNARLTRFDRIKRHRNLSYGRRLEMSKNQGDGLSFRTISTITR